MPALFVGHGNPMNALLKNPCTRQWAALGRAVPQTEGDPVMSAHWYIEDAAVPGPSMISADSRVSCTKSSIPRPAIPTLLRASKSFLRRCRSGATSVGVSTTALGRCCAASNPQADIPVVQLSIDQTQPPSFHFEIGKRLAQLREENVLVLGSGNLVHNLHAYAWGPHAQEPYDWAISFESRVRELLLAGDHKPLVGYETQLGSEADLAVPTPDHYLPLLYIAGTRTASEPVTFPVEGVDGGSVSMLAMRVG